MLDNIKEGSLIITEDYLKKSLLKSLRKEKKLYDFKIMGLNELKKKYYFDYDKKTIYYIHKKYNVIKEVAEIYIQNLYFIEDVDDKKINFLKNIKIDLKQNNLLIEDDVFKKSLKDKNIVFYNTKYSDKFYEKILIELKEFCNVTTVNEEIKFSSKKQLYKFPSKSAEIAFVATKISELIKKGIPIDKIKLANINVDYTFELKNTFKDFNIPLETTSDETISSSILVENFKENFSDDISYTLEKIKPLIKTTRDNKIYKKIIDIINDYNWAKNYTEVKDFIFADIAAEKIPSKKQNNSVHILDFIDNVLNDEYVFLLNFNQNVIPKIFKDEDYLDDKLKTKLGLSDSIDLNKKSLAKIQDNILKIKNLTVTYSEKDLNGELYISNAYDEKLFTNCECETSFEHSNKYNKKILVKEKDENRKYGTTSKTLHILNNHYLAEPYLDYDNTFKGINKETLKKHLENKLVLSYSSMNTYYLCAYRYFLENILNLNTFEDTFEITIGNIFHKILSQIFNNKEDFDILWDKTIMETEYEFKDMENFFLSILKEELKFIIDTIYEQQEFTDLSFGLYEQKIEVLINTSPQIIFKGFIDKILYNEIDNQKIVSIIDYKTGNPELNIDNSVYGLEMQLPIYAYLVKNFEPLKNAKIGGFYLQKILNNTKDIEKKKNSLKLQGYSNTDTSILSHVDKSYADSKLIKSLKQSPNGFGAYSKVLSLDEIDRLIEIVAAKIEEASNNILEGNFQINPKQIEDKLLGCKFCKFKSACFMKNADITVLEKKNKKDFLGGETDANMD